MPTVGSETMFLSVSATKDSLETHSQAATDQQQQHQDQKSLTLADPALVESMQSAEKEIGLLHVLAYQECLEIPMCNVSQNVQSTLNAQQTKLVLIRNVWIHVQESVAPMPAVQLGITILPAPVTPVTLETPSDTAQESQHYQFQQKL